MGAGIAAGPHCPRSYGLPKLSAVPGIGFRPRPCGLGRFPFGFPSEAEAPSRFPGRPIEANFDGTLSGSPPGQALPVSRESGAGPKSIAQLFPVPFGANSSGFRSGVRRSEASPDPFRGSFARRLRFRWTSGESGVGSGLRLCLTLLPRSARPSSLSGFPEGPPLPLWAASGPSSLRFRRNRLPGCRWTVHVPFDSRKRNLPVDNGDNGDKILI
jgi:hypothetical protein